MKGDSCHKPQLHKDQGPVISNLPRNLPASNPPQRKLCSSTLFYLPCSVTIDQKQAQTLNTNEQHSALQSRLRKLHILESAAQLFRWSKHVHCWLLFKLLNLEKKTFLNLDMEEQVLRNSHIQELTSDALSGDHMREAGKLRARARSATADGMICFLPRPFTEGGCVTTAPICVPHLKLPL